MEFTQEELVLLETLGKTTSQDVEVVKSAETKLTQWEIEPGYYSTLLKIILNHSIDPTVRWVAASVFKNGINKYWRKTADNAIPEQEKVSLRCDVMNTFGEPVNAVAIQLAILISAIARFDCPKEWPELIPNLIEIIKSGNPLVQYRGLWTMNQVIKVLASKRLSNDIRLFQCSTADIYSFMLNYWNGLFQNFVSQVHNNDPLCQGTLEKILLTLKILRKLTVYGFKDPSESRDVISFVTSLFERTKDMFLFRKYGAKASDMNELSEKVISNMTKVLLSLLENHPNAFVSFIHPSLNFIRLYVFTESDSHVLFEKFIIQCLNLMKAIVLSHDRVEYRRCLHAESSVNESTVYLEATRIKNEFFQTQVLEEICTKLLTHYFLLTRKDLEMWEDDPESFAFDDIGDSWKFYLHPCAHSLYLALLLAYKAAVVPLVLKLVRNNQQIVDPQDLDGILKKDAVYNAIGLCPFKFSLEMDFDQWFTTTLVHELGIKESNYRIIRRRVVWLIGRLTTDFSSMQEHRPAICNGVIQLLHKDEDMVVRLTAAVALKDVVDSWGIESNAEFIGFLGSTFSMLFSLLQEVKECSSKMQILDVLSFIVGRVGEDIRPYSESLIQYLPLLWEESANHNMLRCAIVSTLAQFVKGLMSENLTSFLYPVIEYCTDVTNDAHIYLIEDGLKLWFTVVEHSSALTPELFGLYRNMPVILEYTLEHLECCCNIIEEYILLNPEKFLSECGEPLMKLCSSLLTDVNDRGIEKIMQIVETAIKANPDIAVNFSFPMLVCISLSVLELETWSKPMSMYLAIIGRVLLYSKDVFSKVLEKAASSKSWGAESLLEKVLIIWNKMMPFVTQLEKRKLLALALSSLLTVQSTVVLSQFAAIVKNIVEALNDVFDIDDLTLTKFNSVMLVEDLSLFSNDDTKIESRKKQLNEADPVFKIELKEYLQLQFNDLKNQVGSSNFEGLLQTVDAEILQQCRLYVAV